MNLIFIYGPPASGKLTVAKELAKITGYKVFNNHTFVSCIADIFPFEEKELDEVRGRLSRKIRLEIFEEAAKAGVDVVSTFGMSGPRYFEFFRELKETVEKGAGNILFVQLIASKESLLERVEAESRKGNKIDSKDFLNSMLNDKPEVFERFPDVKHPTIDNTNLSSEEAAQKILDYYSLS